MSRWLFRQGELSLGPLDEEALAQKILDRELGEDTEAKELEEEFFRPLREIEVFAIALAKAKAKQRVDVISEKRAQAKRKRLLKTVIAVFSLLVLGSVAAYVVGEAWARKKPAVPTDAVAFAGFSSELPTITRSTRASTEDTLLPYRDSKTPSTGARSLPKGSRGSTWVDDVTIDARWNQESILKVLNSHERRMLGCLRDNVRTTNGWSRGEKVNISVEFTIANTGRVNKLSVSLPRHRGRDLEACLFQEMEKWPFAPYDGDQPVITWPISWTVTS